MKKKKKKLSVKDQVLLNLQYANTIFAGLNNYLIPAHNLYWCLFLGLDHNASDFYDLVNNYKNLRIYLKDCLKIYAGIWELTLKHPKLQEKIHELFYNNLSSLSYDIPQAIENIESLVNYDEDHDLHSVVKVLHEFYKQVISSLGYLDKFKVSSFAFET